VGKYLGLYRILLKTFGFKLRPLGTFGLLQAHHALNMATLAADRLLYPAFTKLPLDRPVFVLGNPRSGTTFMHRFLLNTDRMAAFQLWEMLFPAITARKLFGPFVDRLAPLSPARYHSAAAHETSLRDVETDDAMAFFRFMDGGFLWSYFLAWDDTWGSERCRAYFELDDEPEAATRKHFGYMEGCWRRNLLAKDKARIIVKASTYTLRVKTLLRRYPSCKMIYMVRDPVDTIPSGMSMLTGVLEKSYDMFNTTREGTRKLYLENLYQASCHLFRYFHEVWKSGAIPEDNLMIVPYPRMMSDLEGTMRDVVRFMDVDPAEGFAAKVASQADKQRRHESKHGYSLEKYGLTADRIRSDLDFVYRDFGLD
jgi:hypothetical protein